MMHRRNFFKATALAVAAPAVRPLLKTEQAFNELNSTKNESPLQLGLAGYTFLNFNVDDSIAMMRRVGISYVTLKDFHLPLNSTPEKIQEIIGKFTAANITVYGVGVLYMKTSAEIDRAFEYAKNAGVEMIVGVPGHDLLSYTEQKVKTYNIKMAIHNHGPEDKLYPGPKQAYDRIKDMDARMGLCLDIGHSLRAGEDPAKAVRDYSKRLFDLHIKDLVSAEPNAKVIEGGRGVMNFHALVQALHKIKFTGRCSIEYEKDMKDPIAGIAETKGYFKGVMNTLA